MLEPGGIAYSAMTPAQRRLLEKVIDVYLGRVAPELAKARLDAAAEGRAWTRSRSAGPAS